MKTPAHDDQARAGAYEYEQGELFDRHLNASFPSPDSQAGIALAEMLTGKHLRQAEWLHIGWRLAAAIKELNYLGWPVVSVLVEVSTRKRAIADYSLPQWVLREVGALPHG
jgi:hypothetical protein